MARTASSRAAALAAVALGLVGAASPASADAIDGDWCREAASLTIRGPELVVTGGKRISGDYDRHGFRYVVPPGEPASGTEVVMVLRGEELMVVVRQDPATRQRLEPETWRRCRPIS